MDPKAESHASDLIEILRSPEDLDPEIEEARDALIEDLMGGDEIANHVANLFMEIIKEDKYKNLRGVGNNDPSIELHSGNPEEVRNDPSKWPTTSYIKTAHYEEGTMNISFKYNGQATFRRPAGVRERVGDYDVFVECFWIEDDYPELDGEELAEFTVKQMKDEIEAYHGQLHEDNTYYVVDPETDEVVGEFSRRELKEISPEDLQ